MSIENLYQSWVAKYMRVCDHRPIRAGTYEPGPKKVGISRERRWSLGARARHGGGIKE